ncbi:hypothetical protein PF005_g11027 [Phytophthora fragariae]|uniref:Secreted protein n=1 Tax=Phytophthora fragariae TaxID=53985 RepID=A0A6A4D9S8_9STRA|nr:hypothetical protein PF003_g4536 [Phytophthora fragariae]KAE8938945.1 hypothetical protein PF009_g11193 [Phytophthora fragariae]KAE9010159.1 hypothetical protein PF011_g9945 [Phytophthora fragariae]KAE9111975.1 hypothetical protein PF010_g10614 [Phytophthora fragariae]KAE9112291.1 hypothetical protein PF007_g11155 [Phytophthora fragariae]
MLGGISFAPAITVWWWWCLRVCGLKTWTSKRTEWRRKATRRTCVSCSHPSENVRAGSPFACTSRDYRCFSSVDPHPEPRQRS